MRLTKSEIEQRWQWMIDDARQDRDQTRYDAERRLLHAIRHANRWAYAEFAKLKEPVIIKTKWGVLFG